VHAVSRPPQGYRWQQLAVRTSAADSELVTVPPTLIEHLTDTLAYAGQTAKVELRA
jgi:hypothetical protein